MSNTAHTQNTTHRSTWNIHMEITCIQNTRTYTHHQLVPNVAAASSSAPIEVLQHTCRVLGGGKDLSASQVTRTIFKISNKCYLKQTKIWQSFSMTLEKEPHPWQSLCFSPAFSKVSVCQFLTLFRVALATYTNQMIHQVCVCQFLALFRVALATYKSDGSPSLVCTLLSGTAASITLWHTNTHPRTYIQKHAHRNTHAYMHTHTHTRTQCWGFGKDRQ